MDSSEIHTLNNNTEIVTRPALSILDISWEDVLESHLLPCLSWKDLFHLRATSVLCKQLVDEYMRKLRVVDFHFQSTLVQNGNNTPPLSIAFKVVIKDCVSIRTLILTDNSWITDSDLAPVFCKIQRLMHLDLCGCLGLTGTSILPLVIHCKELRILKLRGCTWVSQGIMETLTTHLQRLQEVDLSSCSALSNAQIIPFLQAFPGLRVLELAGIQSVNDATMVAVARSCPSLTRLNIRACVSVTDNGLRNLAEYSTQLTSLEIAHCHQITERSLSYLRGRGDVRIDRPVSDAEPSSFRSYYQLQV